jgi:hypothetical protein
MNIKQIGELKTYLKNAITKGGGVGTESLSKVKVKAPDSFSESGAALSDGLKTG